MSSPKSTQKVSRKKKAAAEAKKRKLEHKLNPRQSRFAAAWIRTRSLKQAALEAGYSPKNASASGAQVLAVIKEKAPEAMSRIGLSLETLIKKYLIPLLEASETRFAQFEGEFTDYVETDALAIRLGALRTALELHGAIGSGAIEAALEESRRAGVDVFVIDIPRPGPGYDSDDVAPVAALPESTNGHKNGNELPPQDEDPRPKD